MASSTTGAALWQVRLFDFSALSKAKPVHANLEGLRMELGAAMSHKIFLVFSNTGAGHRTAAEAIKKAILEICQKDEKPQPEIIIEDIVEESNSINRLFAHMYNGLLRHHQEWMKYYFSLIEWIKPNESDIGYRLACTYTRRLIRDMEPTVIVSVHPMVNHYLARTLKDLGWEERIKLITVLTDPSSILWTGWACPDAYLTIAPNDLARDRLISMGLPEDRVKVMGMPIKPEFLKPPEESRWQMLGRLGLDPETLTVIVTAGSAGGGNMSKIYSALRGVKKPIQVVFICGKNAKLREKIEEESRRMPFKTFIVPYANSMSEIMSCCDLLVTKAGGLTTFEAVARRLPMAFDLLTEPMPQEKGNVDLLVESGLAKPVYKPEDIVDIVESVDVDFNRISKPLPKEHSLDQVNAVYDIARTILDVCEEKALSGA